MAIETLTLAVIHRRNDLCHTTEPKREKRTLMMFLVERKCQAKSPDDWQQ